YFVNLKTLVCEGNNLTDLDVSGCTDLQELSCGENQLATLNISGCTALRILDCSYNKLASLNVSECTALQQLYCYDNQLTALDVSNKTKLETLGCTGNRLTTLNVSNDTALRRLWCKENQLTALDLSSCPNIDRNDVYCDNGVIITWPSSATSSAYAPPASQSGLSSANDSTVILAVLPSFTPTESGTYTFTISLDRTPPKGSSLLLLSDSEDINGSFALTESPDTVTVSADFTAGRTYTPVIAAVPESSQGGCNSGNIGAVILLFGIAASLAKNLKKT
ncbi:MAG: leucine-rich repeat domain-containing protein, partial [Synergistaceae bacterium]|nr:leucine-rich repeat domain-containing protein [Synergistaceae bacterium]